jgi:hypothetical protein
MDDINNRISEQEQRVRNKYINRNGKFFDSLTPTENPFENYDLDGIRGEVSFKLELKERGEKYDIHQYSGSTIIEMTKVDFFKTIIEEDPEAQCLYVSYYSGGEDFISFNITNRLLAGDDILQPHILMCQKSEFGSRVKVPKMVVDLGFSNKYGDKMVINNNIVKIIQ